MADQLKTEGASCPKCSHKPAEFQQKGGPMRWECGNCGASGTVQCIAEAIKAKPTVHKHWSNR